MITLAYFALATLLFLVGLRLSAFFSGSETGFYRANILRIHIESQQGDRNATRLLWFTKHPSYFVATILIGNNVANYLVTLALGVYASSFGAGTSGTVEIVLTLCFAPLIFVCGELIPKSLYFRAPMRFLRRDTRFLVWFFRAFLIFSAPLVWLTKLLGMFQGDRRRAEAMGRNRLVQLASQGHRAGIISEIQNTLFHGVLQMADKDVTRSMMPADRVFGVPAKTSRAEILEYARKYGVNHVCLCEDESKRNWSQYVRVIDAAVDSKPISDLAREMPVFQAGTTNLEALLTLTRSDAQFGVIHDVLGDVVGVISFAGLSDQMFRPNPLA